MFPPPEAETMDLEKAARVLPHQNNTGGFFVCCLRKVAELDLSRIFISNKSKEKAAAEERKKSSLKVQRRAALQESRPDANGKCAANSCKPNNTQEAVAASNDGRAGKSERNPLLDGALLPEGCSEEEAENGDDTNHSCNCLAAASTNKEESLYSLAAAACKPGGLFHLLLPADCDLEGMGEVQQIFDFFGFSNKTPLVST